MYFRALKFLSYFIEMALFGLFGKTKKENLNKGLEKTKESVFKKLARVVVGKSKVDDEVLDNLEEVLITSDVSRLRSGLSNVSRSVYNATNIWVSMN